MGKSSFGFSFSQVVQSDVICGFGLVAGLGFLTGSIWMRSCAADMVAATLEGLISILSTDKSASISITLLIARDNSCRNTETGVY